MYQICIDDNGYYAEGVTDNKVKVSDIPSVGNVKELYAYQYDADTQRLIVNEEKLKEIQEEDEVIMPTLEERIAILEELALEQLLEGGGK